MQPTFLQLIRHPGRPARRGTSLIEILVVLVILVVGILSIVRLFPAGFLALRNAENNTFADRLAQGALEQLKKGGNGLPDAIYMYSDADGFNPNFAPGDFDKAYIPSTTGASVDASYNDVNKQRYISNETITVPATRMTSGTSFLPLYIVNYGPIYLPSLDLNVYRNYLRINSLPWTPQTGDSRPNPSDPNTPPRSIDEPTDILQAGQQKYLVDYNGGRLAVPAETYAKNGGGFVNQDFVAVITTAAGTSSVSLSLPSTYDGNWFDKTTATNSTFNNASLPDGPWNSVTLYRQFRYISTSTSPNFDADPYEYAVYSSNFTGAASNPGVIAFNPLASGRNGTPPLQARISYMTADWHILHEDHDVAAGRPTVRLTLGHLKKIGDVQFDQTTYNGFVPGMSPGSDILMLNLDTGAVTSLAAPVSGASGGNTFNDDDNSGNGSATTSATGQYQVSYQNGRITFPDNSLAQHLRFFFEGDADWALSVQKAPSYYKIVNLDVNGNVRTPVSTDYTVLATPGPMPNNCVVDGATEQVYFPYCDAGKTVQFDNLIYYRKVSGKDVAQTVTSGIATISITKDAIKAVPVVNLTGTGLNSANIITDAAYDPTPVDVNGKALPPLQFGAIRGISAQATVIWHERNRWRSRTIDTLLTQTP